MPWWKRTTDLAISAAALVLLGPMMLFVALLIKLSSRGPVLYVAPRMGWRGVPFGQLKFRTMHVGADRHGAFTARDDRRVFAVGRWLRLFKIDELPQVLNILRGEMSVVGPRPEEIATVEKCYNVAQRRALDAVPGLTGLVQVRYFPELSVIDPQGMDPQLHYQQVILPIRLEMDLEYIRRQSFWFDTGLIVWTIYLIVVRAPMMVLGVKPRRVELPQLARDGSQV